MSNVHYLLMKRTPSLIRLRKIFFQFFHFVFASEKGLIPLVTRLTAKMDASGMIRFVLRVFFYSDIPIGLKPIRFYE